VLPQPKRAALLAYLCLRGHGAGASRRDTLLAPFWPDSDDERARAALRAALHRLRRSLGPDVIRTRGDDELWTDLARLRPELRGVVDEARRRLSALGG